MSKRFPIPEFDRDRYKNMPWQAPTLLPASRQVALQDAAKRGDSTAFSGYPVAVDPALAAKFKFGGPNLHAVTCILPGARVKLMGRSWAWAIQRALVLDSLDSQAQVLADWTTPRPMNTRLGPDEGIELTAGPVHVLIGNSYGDHWISNRTLVTPDASQAGKGFAVLSASGDDNNDFHACNLYFSWA